MSRLDKRRVDQALKQVGLVDCVGKTNAQIREEVMMLMKHRQKTKQEIIEKKNSSRRIKDQVRLTQNLDVCNNKLDKLKEILNMIGAS